MGLAAAGAGLALHLPSEVTIEAGSEQEVLLRATPAVLRRWGPTQKLPFTVTATNLNDPLAEAITSSAAVTDTADPSPIYTALGVFVVVALLSGAIALLLLTRHHSPKSVAASSSASSSGQGYTFQAEAKGLAGVKNAPAFVCYHLEPKNVPFHLRLALVNGSHSDTLTEWDDNGNNGGDCLYIQQAAPAGNGKVSLEAWVSGKKVGAVDLGSLTQ